MNTKTVTATARRGCALALLTLLTAIALPVSAATCNGTPRARIDPALGQTVPETTGGVATVVQLNGAPSTPNNPNNLSFAWQYLGSTPAGLGVTLNNPNSEIATFSAPNVGSLGATLHFRLTVCGVAATAATTNVNVTNVVVNNNPVAVATSSPVGPHEGDLVTLDGTGSFDPDPGSTLTYEWAQTAGSPTVTLSNANASGSIVTFVAPNTPIATGASLTFRLTVSDGNLSGSDDEIVNVVWTNDPPVASLVCPEEGIFVVDEGDSVTLDGIASSDSDGSIQSYAWSQDEGLPNIGVGTLTSPSITFSAPQLGFQQMGGFRLILTVTDNLGAQDSADCGVFINDVTAPVIDVPTDITAEADSSLGASVAYEVFAQDAVDDELPYPLACVPPSGSVFLLDALPGNALATPVVCNATDSAGNAAEPATFNITVQDTTAPVITVPGSFGVEATGPGGALANYIATKLDVVDGMGNADCAPASGSNFPLGTTPVTCNATDARLNAADPSIFNLTVHDTTLPVIEPHADVTAEATGSTGASISYSSPATTDIVDGAGTASCSPLSGGNFPLGETDVHCDATDAAGNHAIQTRFTVFVVDTTAPVIESHPDITAEATSSAGANVSYTSPATTDIVGGGGSATCAPASGSTFALGQTTVLCNAADLAGNAATGTSFKVFVVDTTAPVIAAHGNVGPIEATGSNGAVVAYVAPSTSDAVDGPGTATCAPEPGDVFGLGATIVTCHAVDAANNQAIETTFTVNVVDTTPPVIEAHAQIGAVEATGAYGAHVTYTSPPTHDLVDGAGVAACVPVSGSAFALGLNTVTCSASDAAGNPATATTFTIQVVDTTPPVIASHGNVTEEATGPGGASVSYEAPATSDIVDGAGTAVCLPASGDSFPLGESTVHCNAADAVGNDADATSFKVFVVDTTPPVIAPHLDVIAEASGSSGASVSYTSPATADVVDGAGTANCLPISGDNFPLGESTVHCNAADAAGNDAAATSFKVFVVDTTPPVIEPHVDITSEATSSAGASVGYTSPATSDIVDGSGTATCAPASATTFALGETTVLCDAADLAGNEAAQTAFKVFVVDTTAPVVTAPADVTREAIGPLTAISFGNAIAEDAVGVTWLTNNAPALFPLGTTTITWTARDAAGNQGTATSTVTVVDSTAPALTTPGNLIREATSAAGAAVGFTTSAEDLVSGTVAVTCSPVSGSTFALGSSTVACSAADAIGNTGHASFSVTVLDTTGPTIASHADVTATASGNSSAVVNYIPPTASDQVDGLVTVSCLPASGSTFNVGSTTVTCTATDAADNPATPTTFKVIVSYTFNGFFRPIDNLPTINVVKAGSAIPVKFSLGGNQGLNIFAANYPASVSTGCSASQTDAIEETVTAGSSSLQYDPGADQYIYVWKTDKSWTGCRQLQVKLRDGSSRWAMFSFTR